MVKQALTALVPFRSELPMYMRSIGIKHTPQVMAQLILSSAGEGIWLGHLEHSKIVRDTLTNDGWKVIFLYRDLRDAAVSYAHYSTRFKHNLHYQNFANAGNYLERLRRTIEGFDDFPDIGTRMAYFLGWLGESAVFSARYEDILENPIEQYGKMAAYLGFKEERADDMLRAVSPDECVTFRRGIRGSWRDELPEALWGTFNRCAGKINAKLGYGRCE